MLQERIPKRPLVHFGGINANYRLSNKKTPLFPSAQKQKNDLAQLTAQVPDQTPFQTAPRVFLQAQ